MKIDPKVDALRLTTKLRSILPLLLHQENPNHPSQLLLMDPPWILGRMTETTNNSRKVRQYLRYKIMPFETK